MKTKLTDDARAIRVYHAHNDAIKNVTAENDITRDDVFLVSHTHPAIVIQNPRWT